MSRFSRQRNLTQGVPFSTRLDKSSSSKTCLLIGSTDGALGVFLPVEERAYRRLALLQQILSAALETSLALNPRDAHIYRSRKVRPAAKRGVLDGSVLWRFVGLEAIEQDEFAAAMGTTADLVLENLHELDVLTSFF
jgi:cleavage and polyadenylation specificity factor subunit 1